MSNRADVNAPVTGALTDPNTDADSDPTGAADASWAALSTRLWMERELLEELLFKLSEVALVVASGSTRWLNKADEEARRALSWLQDSEIARAAEVDSLIRRLGADDDVTLQQLVAIAPAPWDSLLGEHCEALRELALSIDAAANDNRRRLQQGLDATRETLEQVQAIRSTYNERGTSVAQRPGAYLLDQQA